ISKPLKALAGHAQKLSSAGFSGELLSGADVEKLVSKSKGKPQDEVGELASSFGQMERTLKDHIGRLRQTTLQLEEYSQNLEIKVAKRTHELQEKNGQLEQTLAQLRTAQTQIVMQEKLASLGALTAGIAHEIKNPLNFVNNFSELSVDLVKDLRGEVQRQADKIDVKDVQYIDEILHDLHLNVTKINEHGKRADSIVRNMLQHSRG